MPIRARSAALLPMRATPPACTRDVPNRMLFADARNRASSRLSGALLHAEVLLDVSRKTLVDFGVSGNGLLLPGGRVVVHVMSAAVPEENTAGVGELPDQLGALHTAISFVR